MQAQKGWIREGLQMLTTHFVNPLFEEKIVLGKTFFKIFFNAHVNIFKGIP